MCALLSVCGGCMCSQRSLKLHRHTQDKGVIFAHLQAMYLVVLSIGRLYEHHQAPDDVCDA